MPDTTNSFDNSTAGQRLRAGTAGTVWVTLLTLALFRDLQVAAAAVLLGLVLTLLLVWIGGN